MTVRSGIVIDREAFSPPVLELLLLAEDIGLLNGTADLLVTILDDNDNWPTFNPAAVTVHLLENCPPGRQGSGPAPRQELFMCGDWSLTVWRQKLPAVGRRMGSRVGREGVRRPKSPSLPFSDLQCLVYKTRLLKYVPSMFLYGKTDCFKVKIGLT